MLVCIQIGSPLIIWEHKEQGTFPQPPMATVSVGSLDFNILAPFSSLSVSVNGKLDKIYSLKFHELFVFFKETFTLLKQWLEKGFSA